MGGHVVYVKKEEEGAKDSALWDSRAHVYLTRQSKTCVSDKNTINISY